MKKLILLLAFSFSMWSCAASNDFTCTSSQNQVDKLEARIKALEETINLIKQASTSPKKIYQCIANMENEELNKAQTSYVTNVYDTYRAESETVSKAEDNARSRCNLDLTGALKGKGARCKIKECSAVEYAHNQSQSEQSIARLKQLEESYETLKDLLRQIAQQKHPHYICEAAFMHEGSPWRIFRGEGNSLSEAQKNAFEFCVDGRGRVLGYEWVGRSRPECELLPCRQIAE